MFAMCSPIAHVRFSVCTIDQPQVMGGGIILLTLKNLCLDGMTMTYVWYESYKAVVLETDWTKMHERIQSAESKINDRQRVLSQDHGGTREERQAITNALNGMRTLRTEVADWQSRQVPKAKDAEMTSANARPSAEQGDAA
jgi:hypothetical protein